ncbi:hypothetical protein [Haloparvum sedimenti]|uniref:hypothetical protein n=1 Tax=Haloparvum sedimenti TaxID=1678448 RepID=UPI001FDEB76E|nr:hypothetical protein [Haloparvum sedimenti]
MRSLWDPEDVPDGDVMAPHHFWVGILVSVFGFAFTWTYYSNVGAALTVLGLLIAADDVVEHATGFPTPLDQLWKRVIYPLIVKRIEDGGDG